MAGRLGLPVYATDDVMGDHARRCVPAETPYLQRFAAMSMDERWLNRSPAEMLATFHWWRGEGFGLIADDLAGIAGPVVAEGHRLLPELVAPLLTERHRAVWLLPTPAFRRAAFESRGGLWQIAGRTSDPERALANLLERDRLHTERLRAACAGLDLQVINLEIGINADKTVDRVRDVLRM